MNCIDLKSDWKQLIIMAIQVAAQTNFGHGKKEEQSIRVQDYLNDKLQTTADLSGIDALLEDVRKQQSLLTQQVR